MRHHHRHAFPGCGPEAAAGLPLVLGMSGHRGHRGGPFGGPWGGDFGGRGGWGGPGRRGRRARGDVRAAILLLLAEEPRNGYGLMQEVEARSDGAWRPSPGSVYPALSQLEDEGLIRPSDAGDGKAFELTDAGREHVAEHREKLGSPWEAATRGMPEGVTDLRSAIAGVAQATFAVAQTGDEQHIASAKEILEDARRKLYRLLAGDERS